jgi:hypothetical protein
MFYKRQELLTFREHLSTPQILGAPEYTPVSGSTWVHPSFREHLSTPQFMVVSVLFICLFFCVVFCVLFVFVLCLVCSMLPVSLDCLSSSCVLCAQCYQCLWIVCLRSMSCVLNVTSVFGLFILASFIMEYGANGTEYSLKTFNLIWLFSIRMKFPQIQNFHIHNYNYLSIPLAGIYP